VNASGCVSMFDVNKGSRFQGVATGEYFLKGFRTIKVVECAFDLQKL
jgi:hypothetical protein